MNGTESKIEIFRPFGEAFELMKKILFQPFDIKKWFVIGFAAFLAGHFGGGGVGFPSNWGGRTATSQSISPPNFDQWKPWLPIIIPVFVVVVLALVLVLTWVKARGNFIFTDCIVRNRGAIAAPWREYRKEGNSYFLFQLALMFCSIFLFGLLCAVAAALGLLSHGHAESIGPGLIALLIFLFLFWIALAIGISLVTYFMPFVMYRQKCLAVEAFRQVLRLVSSNVGVFVLFCLFAFVLLLAMTVIGAIATCITCCLAAIPYVGTVILLPICVCLRAFGLCFFRQFGPDYDVWQAIPQAEPVSQPPPIPPPMQG